MRPVAAYAPNPSWIKPHQFAPEKPQQSAANAIKGKRKHSEINEADRYSAAHNGVFAGLSPAGMAACLLMSPHQKRPPLGERIQPRRILSARRPPSSSRRPDTGSTGGGTPNTSLSTLRFLLLRLLAFAVSRVAGDWHHPPSPDEQKLGPISAAQASDSLRWYVPP